MNEKFNEILDDILENKDLRYQRDAYFFTMEALTYTTEEV